MKTLIYENENWISKIKLEERYIKGYKQEMAELKKKASADKIKEFLEANGAKINNLKRHE